MPDLKTYWQEIHEIEKTLGDFVWLVSVGDAKRGRREGSIAQVIRATAARLLHARSHRLATDEEIEAHEKREAAGKKQALQERLRSMGIAITSLPD